MLTYKAHKLVDTNIDQEYLEIWDTISTDKLSEGWLSNKKGTRYWTSHSLLLHEHNINYISNLFYNIINTTTKCVATITLDKTNVVASSTHDDLNLHNILSKLAVYESDSCSDYLSKVKDANIYKYELFKNDPKYSAIINVPLLITINIGCDVPDPNIVLLLLKADMAISIHTKSIFKDLFTINRCERRLNTLDEIIDANTPTYDRENSEISIDSIAAMINDCKQVFINSSKSTHNNIDSKPNKNTPDGYDDS